MAQLNSLNRLGEKINAVRKLKGTEDAPLSLYRVAKDAKVDYSHLYRIMRGKASPSRELVGKICRSLRCTPEERIEIFHAAGYQAPDELDEEQPLEKVKVA